MSMSKYTQGRYLIYSHPTVQRKALHISALFWGGFLSMSYPFIKNFSATAWHWLALESLGMLTLFRSAFAHTINSGINVTELTLLEPGDKVEIKCVGLLSMGSTYMIRIGEIVDSQQSAKVIESNEDYNALHLLTYKGQMFRIDPYVTEAKVYDDRALRLILRGIPVFKL